MVFCVVCVLLCMFVLSVWRFVAYADLCMLEESYWDGGADTKPSFFVSSSDLGPAFALGPLVLCMSALGERYVQI